MIARLAIAAAASTGLFVAPAAAKVISSDPHGFVIEQRVSAAAPPGAVWTALGNVSGWWSKDHTYSGNAANLSLVLSPGGCFCERFPGGGGIEHLRVALVQPGKSLTLTGALGPLLSEAVTGVMEIRIERAGGGATIIATYRASGFARGNAAKLAPLVDQVVGEQARRLAVLAAGKR